jgi:Xaa-Pro aminopeptidase
MTAPTPAGGAASAQGPEPAVKLSGRYAYPGVDGRLLVNKARAWQVLDEAKVDGLIAVTPINVHYLSNTVSTLTKMRADHPAFATFPRDPGQTSFFITSTGGALEAANGDREVPEIIPFSVPETLLTTYAHDAAARPTYEPTALSGRFGVAEGAALTPRETAWLAAQDRCQGQVAPTPLWGLVRALKASGLTRGVVAIDDMGIAPALQHMGLTDVTFVPGANLFRRIRVIKSAPEVALMRVAQAHNADAALAAARALEAGMTYAEFQRRFEVECAARGNVAGFILLGFTQALLPDDEVVRGKSYMLDAFSHFGGYYGDFARTVMVGDPSAEVLRRVRAQQIGRSEGFLKVRPGVSFHAVQAAARLAMIKAGMPEEACRSVTLHSVGLQHMDHPNPMAGPFDAAKDLVLEENMTVTLDLPYLELGRGAGHNEDMLLVTAGGYEVLNDERDPLVVV